MNIYPYHCSFPNDNNFNIKEHIQEKISDEFNATDLDIDNQTNFEQCLLKIIV